MYITNDNVYDILHNTLLVEMQQESMRSYHMDPSGYGPSANDSDNQNHAVRTIVHEGSDD